MKISALWLLAVCLVASGCEGAAQAVGAIVALVIVGFPIMVIVSLLDEWKTKKDRIKESVRREEELARQERRRQADYENQKQLEYVARRGRVADQLAAMAHGSVASLQRIPGHIQEASRALDAADTDFGEGAFAPFWDAVERAIRALGQIYEETERVRHDAHIYAQDMAQYQLQLQPFPISQNALTVLAPVHHITQRLSATVRQAQRNFQFATIFEQRKTNQVLVAGFTSLAHALDGVGARIEGAVEALGAQISRDISRANASLGASMATINTTLETNMSAMQASAEQANAQFKAAAGRQDRALDMLDNIQRGKKPLL